MADRAAHALRHSLAELSGCDRQFDGSDLVLPGANLGRTPRLCDGVRGFALQRESLALAFGRWCSCLLVYVRFRAGGAPWLCDVRGLAVLRGLF